MIVLPPVAAAQAGQASGGGLLDTFKNAISGATGGAGTTQAAPPPAGDGSVGLFDGILKKALFGGAAGAAMGFLPFIPGGPILGGIVGALGGAAMGVFSNWRKMSAIKAENEAMLAAMGVQADDPQVKQILQSGNVSQLIPLMQQGATQTAPVQQGATQTAPVQQGRGPVIQQVTDPATGVTQMIDVTTGQVVQEGAGSTGQATQATTAQVGTAPPPVVETTAMPSQSPVPTQGSIAVGSGAGGAINPNAAVNPGVAPAMQYASGGGGAAGDAGRPPAPAGINSADTSAIAPVQAGIGAPASAAVEAAAGVDTLQVDTGRLDRSQLSALIIKLQQQVEQLKQFLAEQERNDQLDKAQAR